MMIEYMCDVLKILLHVKLNKIPNEVEGGF